MNKGIFLKAYENFCNHHAVFLSALAWLILRMQKVVVLPEAIRLAVRALRVAHHFLITIATKYLAPLLRVGLKLGGAIAIDPVRAKMGTSKGEMSERAAKKAAIADCRAQGGSKDCTINLAYRNQCAVVVSGDNASSTARAESIEIATKIAMSRCINDGDGNCQLFYSACSGPVRIQ